MTRFVLFAAVAGLAAIPTLARAETTREALAAPAGAVVLRVHAVGAQIYQCAADGHDGLAWTFREPIATLIRDGRTVGRHFAGPTWELADGSSVRGRVIDTAAGEAPGDVPWLKLAVVQHGGAGDLAEVATVQRIATAGGDRSGPCPSAGALAAVPYAADYVFSK